MMKSCYREYSAKEREAYLERIGFCWDGRVSEENLHALVYAHQLRVPFENLDLYPEMKEVSLAPGDLFRKIVANRRGGFCFELNGAFVLLLRSMGYDAYSCACRVVTEGNRVSPLTHQAVIVRLQGCRFLADVGFGGPMAPFALVFPGKERQVMHGESHWIESLEEGWYVHRRLRENGTEEDVIVFAEQLFLPDDFEIFKSFVIGGPDSWFRIRRMVNIRTEGGHRSISNNELILAEGGNVQRQHFEDRELERILERYFGITPSAKENTFGQED